MAKVQLGRIPGLDYSIATWTVQSLRTWLQENLSALLPQSVKVPQVQSDEITVNTQLTLSTAALADLKRQLGI